MDTFWHLEKEDFFKGIDEAKSAFLKNAQRLELPKNEMVFLEGDAGDSCFYIESGLIRIFCMDRAGKGVVLLQHGFKILPVDGVEHGCTGGLCAGLAGRVVQYF